MLEWAIHGLHRISLATHLINLLRVLSRAWLFASWSICEDLADMWLLDMGGALVFVLLSQSQVNKIRNIHTKRLNRKELNSPQN